MYVIWIPTEASILPHCPFVLQALKGAPKGNVRIGVSKPLPVADSSTTLSQEGSGSTAGDDNTEVRSEMSDMETDAAGTGTGSGFGGLDDLQGSPTKNRNMVDELPPPLPTRLVFLTKI